MMIRRISLLLLGLLLVGMYLPFLGFLPAQAQPFTSSGTRFGLNISAPQYTEYAYTDVFMEALGWGGAPSLTSNGYPTTGTVSYGVNTAALWFCLFGDPPGPNIYQFYGEGIFSIYQWNGSFSTNYSYVPGTLSVLPPNYPGNPTSNAYVVPANYAGNPTNNPVYLYWGTIAPNTPPNPLPINLYLPPNSPPNTLSVPVTTCSVQYTIPARVSGGYSLAQSLPLSWFIITNINPQGLANQYPNNFHLIRPGYRAWKSTDYFYPVTLPGSSTPAPGTWTTSYLNQFVSYPIFTAEYLNSCGPFCCLRCMDWMNANGNTGLSWSSSGTLVNSGPYTWAGRPPCNAGQYIGCGSGSINVGGACYENMIALCNLTGCDLWISVPLQATDDWKIGFANLVANDPVYHLNPGLHVYYEHCNEMWNWGFIAWQIVEVWAQADFASYESTKGAWFCHGMEMGKLLMSDVDDMQSIFGPTVGRPIVGGQFAGAASYAGGGLFYIQNFYGPPKNYVYGMEGAAYFGDLTSASISGLQSQMNTNMQMANQYGIHMCAYEAGQGLASTPLATYTANAALQTTTDMANQHWALAQMWQQSGGDLMNWFARDGVWSQFGFWGVLPLGSYYDDLSDPVCTKYNAIAAMNNSFGCNCGNAPPPPPPAPPTPPPPPPSPAPPPPPPPPSSSSSSSSSSQSVPGARYLGDGRWWSPIYGNYSDSPSYSMPKH